MTEKEIFVEALARDGEAERAAFLDEACGPDAALRRRVELLLARHPHCHPLLDRQPADLLDALGQPATPTTLTPAEQLAPLLGPSARPGALGRLGHYDVLEVLGQGGYGIVVKAFDDSLHRAVAIKLLAPHLAATSPPRKRFLREAKAIAQVKHEHAVQIHAVHEQPVPYLVMEFVEGQTLQQKLDATGPLEAAEVVRLGRQIALGLGAAHDKGLIHRDVKPANILLEAGPVEPRVKLTDFGLARAADDASLTQSGVLAGTPMFMAPEQVHGLELDARADLFSLGSVLYTMTAGRPPFRAPSPFAVLKRVAEDTPRPLREVMGGVPPGLVAVINKLLSKRPEDRYATAQQAADALARCLTDPLPTPVARAPRRKATLVVLAVLLLVAAGWLLRPFGRPTAHDGDVPEGAVPPLNASSGGKESVDGKSASVKPKTNPWEAAVALMGAEDQVTTVVAKLKQLNPQFDEKSVEPTIENGVVVGLSMLNCGDLNDLAPLRALAGLKGLYLRGNGAADLRPLKGMKLERLSTQGPPIRDLSPLAGMPLKTCSLWGFATDDLSPLAGMRLEAVNVGASPVKDISVLRSMPLTYLCLNHTQVEDLSPLEGMPLDALECNHTKVTDIKPLAKAPLKYLTVKGSPIADYSPLQSMSLESVGLDYRPEMHAKLLRSIATLKKINDAPAAEVLGEDGR